MIISKTVVCFTLFLSLFFYFTFILAKEDVQVNSFEVTVLVLKSKIPGSKFEGRQL